MDQQTLRHKQNEKVSKTIGVQVVQTLVIGRKFGIMMYNDTFHLHITYCLSIQYTYSLQL